MKAIVSLAALLFSIYAFCSLLRNRGRAEKRIRSFLDEVASITGGTREGWIVSGTRNRRGFRVVFSDAVAMTRPQIIGFPSFLRIEVGTKIPFSSEGRVAAIEMYAVKHPELKRANILASDEKVSIQWESPALNADSVFEVLETFMHHIEKSETQ